MTDRRDDAPTSRTGGSPVLGIVGGLLPWIVFAVVAHRPAADGVAWGALIALVMTLVALGFDARRHAPTRLALVTLVLFAVITVTGFAGGPSVDLWLHEWGRPLVGVLIGLLMLVTVPLSPFTAEYARRSTPREYWDSPVFLGVNRVLSAAWGSRWS
jgi:uncharacterized membrane protein (UPF0136 family)